jgi:hypothetical protein
MRLNLRLIGVLFGILMLTVVGRVLLRSGYLGGGRSRDGNKKGGNPLPLLGLAMILIGYIGVFFANLIKSAVSRQREFLADAAAVQYTRNPDGIAGALKKIAGFSLGAKIANPHAAEASHLFFGDALGRGLAGWFATHPPLQERIRRLDPAFHPEVSPASQPPAAGERAEEPGAALSAGFAATGVAGTVDLGAAESLLRRFPAELREALHDPVDARAMIYALLWATSPSVQEAQQRAVEKDPGPASRLDAMLAHREGLSAGTRLPLAGLAVPALRMMTREEYDRFGTVLDELIAADESMDLFEYALTRMIRRHVEPAFGRVSSAPVRHRTVESVLGSCQVLLASLAAWGGGGQTAAETAYRAGMLRLTANPPEPDMKQASLEAVDSALAILAEASPGVKRRLLDACATCVMTDRRTTPEEGELLRAIADSLDVPMPPDVAACDSACARSPGRGEAG